MQRASQDRGLGAVLALCVVTTALSAIAIYIPFEMLAIVRAFNEDCFGTYTQADIWGLRSIRYRTWAGSFVGTGACVAALLYLQRGRHRTKVWRNWLLGSFVIWKAATLFYDSFGSPICWEPYANDSPFWDEPIGTGLAIWLQPLGFVALCSALAALTVVTWGGGAMQLMKATKRGN